MEKSLDRKLARIHADGSCRDFILADAKDADMAFGLSPPGQSPEHHADEARFRTLDEYRQLMREIVGQGADRHHADERQLERSADDPGAAVRRKPGDAGRAAPTTPPTSGWRPAAGGTRRSRRGRSARRPSTTSVRQAGVRRRRSGVWGPTWACTRSPSTTTSRWTADSLEAYNAFRLEAEAKGFRHFLEVFDPNACGEHAPPDLARFINDHIARTLAGVTSRGRPVFLKIPYHGPAAMEALVALRPFARGGHSGRLGRHDATTPSTCCGKRRSTARAWPCTDGRSTAPSTS